MQENIADEQGNIHDEQESNYDCDDLPSLKVGNVTKWGCPAMNSKSDCTKNGSWGTQCCTRRENECVEINKG